MAGFPGWSAGAGQPWIQPGYQPQLPPEPPPPLPDEQPPPLPPGAAPQATLHQATHFPPVQSTPNFSQSTGQPNFPSLPVQYTFPGGYPQMQHAAQAYYPQAAPGPAGAPTTFPAPGQPSYPMNMTPMHLQATLPQQSPPFFWDGFQWVPTPAPAVQPVQQHWHPGALGVPAPGAAHQQPAWGHTGAVGPVLTSTGASDVSKLLQPLVVSVRTLHSVNSAIDGPQIPLNSLADAVNLLVTSGDCRRRTDHFFARTRNAPATHSRHRPRHTRQRQGAPSMPSWRPHPRVPRLLRRP